MRVDSSVSTAAYGLRLNHTSRLRLHNFPGRCLEIYSRCRCHAIVSVATGPGKQANKTFISAGESYDVQTVYLVDHSRIASS
uniref:Uncharacterized protein n=1 Tax=Arion vulgaris TaxID=1028688 RepID=A0A0B6ZBZ8_9EUPU